MIKAKLESDISFEYPSILTKC